MVDCPGHASLIKTIIGGAQIIDLMMLVIDITKGAFYIVERREFLGGCACEWPCLRNSDANSRVFAYWRDHVQEAGKYCCSFHLDSSRTVSKPPFRDGLDHRLEQGRPPPR